MSLLDVQGLTIRFGGLTAVGDLEFSVERGQIFSIIGPNGAGKTTVFNGVTAIYEPDAGSIRLEGRDVRRPLSAKVVCACAFIGISVGLASLLFASNVDLLWKTSLKDNYAGGGGGGGGGMEWGRALRDAGRFLWGSPQISQEDSGWQVRTHDRRKLLAKASSEAEAEAKRREFEPNLAQRWTVILFGWVGLALGCAGSFAIWWRTRRTPDYLSRNGVARTFQNIRLFQNLTALENALVALDVRDSRFIQKLFFLPPRDRALRTQAEELLRYVGLSHRASTLARNLPYGDQRRLEIARALATQPLILLLDEPAAGMNPVEAQELMKLIQQIRSRGTTVLLIEHHMKVVMGISDRVIVLDHGVKIAEGTPDQVRRDPKVMEAYLGKEDVG